MKMIWSPTKRLRVSLLLIVLAASGCAMTPEECDPANPSLLLSAREFLSGGKCYEGRLNERQKRLAELRKEQGRLEKESAATKGRSAEQAQRISALKRRILATDGEIQKLNARKASMSGAGKDASKEEAELRKLTEERDKLLDVLAKLES